MNRLRRWIKRWFDLYDLDDLQVGGNCGCCGKWINEVLPKSWTWGLCEECRTMKRPIDFQFCGHTGSFSAVPTSCPIDQEVCCVGTMKYDKTWIVFDKVGDMYEVCPRFGGLGENVPVEGTSNSHPIVVECKGSTDVT